MKQGSHTQSKILIGLKDETDDEMLTLEWM